MCIYDGVESKEYLLCLNRKRYTNGIYTRKEKHKNIPPKRARLILLYPDQPSSPIHTHYAGAKATQTPTPTSAIQHPARLLSPQKSCIVSSPLALGPLPERCLHLHPGKNQHIPQSRYHHSLSAEPRFFGFPSRRAGQSPTLVSPRSANKLRPRANPCINQYW